MASEEQPEWPPKNPRVFIEGEAFGAFLIGIASAYSKRYPQMDFSDAVAHIFVAIDRRLAEEPDFLSLRRFPRLSAFRAYIGQAMWNSGLLAQRQQSRTKQLDDVTIAGLAPSASLSPERLAEVHEAVEKLSEPYRSIIERTVLGDDDIKLVLSSLDEDPDCSDQRLEEALDLLAEALI